MKIKTLEVAGFGPAITAMRNPMNSWDRSDSKYRVTCTDAFEDEELSTVTAIDIGEKDKDLSMKLARNGPEHAKHLRMIFVWADICAERFWWNEADTYRFGVEKVSCSTMHKITAKPFEYTDFGFEEEDHDSYKDAMANAAFMEDLRQAYLKADEEHKKEAWYRIIRNLPQSYIQKRTVVFSYAALRNIYRQRKNHKLGEWHTFCDWVKTLPESWMITDEE